MTLLQQLPRRPSLLAFVLVCAISALHCSAQTSAAPRILPQPDLSLPAVRWAEWAGAAEEHIINYDPHQPVRYQVQRVDAKGNTVREVIESVDGPVARLLRLNGQPLTVDEDAAERQRLQAMLDDPEAFFRHQRREAGSRTYVTELLRTMPRAMLWSYAPGQPQLPNTPAPTVVLDFKPDPRFKPPSLVTEALTGIAGRLWIDPGSHVVTRIQGSILHPVDFGWGGFLARIREGGTVELEQTEAANGRWLYSHLVEHLTIREVLVHTVQEDAETAAVAVRPLVQPVPYRTAIQMLLAIPVPTR